MPFSQCKGLFSKRRQLILTDGPRLVYVDVQEGIVKGEIPWFGASVCGLRAQDGGYVSTVQDDERVFHSYGMDVWYISDRV